MEPFACVLRGQNALAIRPGEVVLVMGAGPIGVMHTKLAKARGAGRVIVSEPLADRRAQAPRMGADRVVDPAHEDLQAAVLEESDGRGADVVIVAAPAHAAQEAALQLAAIGGRINFFGGLPKDRPTISTRFQPGPLQGAGRHRNHGLQHGRLLAGCEIVGAGLVDLSTWSAVAFR